MEGGEGEGGWGAGHVGRGLGVEIKPLASDPTPIGNGRADVEAGVGDWEAGLVWAACLEEVIFDLRPGWQERGSHLLNIYLGE